MLRWMSVYRPVLIVFLFVLLITLCIVDIKFSAHDAFLE
jgi:hypothetical protein